MSGLAAATKSQSMQNRLQGLCRDHVGMGLCRDCTPIFPTDKEGEQKPKTPSCFALPSFQGSGFGVEGSRFRVGRL